MRVSFDVLGSPAPQGSKKAFVVAGRAIMKEAAGARHKAWRGAVAEAARQATYDVPGVSVGGQFTGPTHLEVRFRLARPASRAKKHHGWSTIAPDLDKLLRATFDGLTDGGLISDDSIICSIGATKMEVPDWTGAIIRLYEISMTRDEFDEFSDDAVPREVK